MKVVATVLVGGGTESILNEALASVNGCVDLILLIDTTLEPRAELLTWGNSYFRHAHFPWTGSYSDARNFALVEAAKYGDWAVTLDTDERLRLRNVQAVHAMLEEAQMEGVNVVSLRQSDRSYDKERFFRLPAAGIWLGPTHEHYDRRGQSKGQAPDFMFFDELPSTPEQLKEKAALHRVTLLNYLDDHPNNPRWWFYLGECCMILEEYDDAITAYHHCAKLNGWDEEGAWACYRAAECSRRLGKLAQALNYCSMGLAIHPGVAELAWLAGIISLEQRGYEKACYWARIATVHGLFMGDGADIKRVGFKYPKALWEGPYEVMAEAQKQLGHLDKAAEHTRMAAAARARRGAL